MIEAAGGEEVVPVGLGFRALVKGVYCSGGEHAMGAYRYNCLRGFRTSGDSRLCVIDVVRIYFSECQARCCVVHVITLYGVCKFANEEIVGLAVGDEESSMARSGSRRRLE